MTCSCSAGSPRTINPPTAPQPNPSTESCIPVRPNIRNCIDVPPADGVHNTPNQALGSVAVWWFVEPPARAFVLLSPQVAPRRYSPKDGNQGEKHDCKTGYPRRHCCD